MHWVNIIRLEANNGRAFLLVCFHFVENSDSLNASPGNPILQIKFCTWHLPVCEFLMGICVCVSVFFSLTLLWCSYNCKLLAKNITIPSCKYRLLFCAYIVCISVTITFDANKQFGPIWITKRVCFLSVSVCVCVCVRAFN